MKKRTLVIAKLPKEGMDILYDPNHTYEDNYKRLMESPLGGRIKEARCQQGMTREALGRKIGLPIENAESLIQEIEHNHIEPAYEAVFLISCVLQYPVLYFYAKFQEEVDLVLEYDRAMAIGAEEYKKLADQITYEE